MLDLFTLQGTTYRQEYRKCNNANCKCHNPDQDGHGPYWYARGWTGKRRYIGKELPLEIQATRGTYNKRLQEITWHRTRLATQLDALHTLITTQALTDSQQQTLIEMGYANCLVPNPTR